MKENITKIDPLTNEKFIPKRINQRFASASNRIRFNNKVANVLRQERAKINVPLYKTHRLLKALMGSKNEAEFSNDFLDGYGLQFNVFNHFTTIKGVSYPCVFEFVIIPNSVSNTVKIIKHGGY